MKGRAVVDFEGFFTNNSVFRESLSPNDSKVDHDSREDSYGAARSRSGLGLQRSFTDSSVSQLGFSDGGEGLSDDEICTFPPLVPIFSFAARQWCLAFIDDLSVINWQPSVFENLEIMQSTKESLQGLVQGYSTHAVEFDDFVEGKGRGLVFLLYGPSGCGKTMTAGEITPSPRTPQKSADSCAEGLSESLEKPLYHVSGGELGSNIQSIQYALENAFDRAARWDAILLLDEADAFLARRDGENIERNAMIAGKRNP